MSNLEDILFIKYLNEIPENFIEFSKLKLVVRNILPQLDDEKITFKINFYNLNLFDLYINI